jgi:hypothetical protein
MKKFSVYYTDDLTAIYRGKPMEVTKFDRVAVVDASDLEDLFRKMNVVDGDELPVELKVRSMSCGDVARDLSTGDVWLCDLAGWVNLSDPPV